MAQVILVGDLNIAASQQDVHGGCDFSQMYSPEEKAALQALLGDLTDTWRLQHPETTDAFTVWDEKTNARFSNRVWTCVNAVEQSCAALCIRLIQWSKAPAWPANPCTGPLHCDGYRCLQASCSQA